jgi:nitrile hydratase subunit beta
MTQRSVRRSVKQRRLSLPDRAVTIHASYSSRKILMHAYHDLGGTPAGPIEQDDHPAVLWEKRVEALLTLVRRRGLLTTDENRRALESLGADVYHNLSYAERRALALSNNMIAKGVFTIDELAAKLAEIDRRKDPLP